MKTLGDVRTFGFLVRQYHANFGKGGKATLQVRRYKSDACTTRWSIEMPSMIASELDRAARHWCLKEFGRMAVIQNESAAARYAVSDVCLSTQTPQKRFSQEIKQEFDSDGNHPSDDFEFARGAIIATAMGLAMWAVVFLIVRLVFS